jgi:hypothetical protein
MLALVVLGRIVAKHHPVRVEGSTTDGPATVETSLLALFGLLVAFSFSGSETRLDARRALIVDEANAIGTAYLRIDMLPEAYRPEIKELFRRYVDARIAYYHDLRDMGLAHRRRAVFQGLQQQIWTRSLEACRHADPSVRLLMVPTLNEMFDITLSREAALYRHIPRPIFFMLALLAFSCSFMLGRSMYRPGRLSRLHAVAFAGTIAATAFLILNIEFPRLGFLHLERLDALLGEVRRDMR